MDLAQWVADGRWEALLELIDQLPSASRLNEAIAQDDEAADELVKFSDQDDAERSAWSPRVAEFNLSNMLMVSLINEIKLLSQTVIASGGGKPKKVQPFPTPKTAIDRARERQDLNLFREMQAMFGFGK